MEVRHGALEGESLPVRAIGSHGVEGVCHRKNAGKRGIVWAAKTVRISCSVPALMVIADNGSLLRAQTKVLDDAFADERMGLDYRELIICELAWFVENGIVDPDLADVVECATEPK